MKVIDIVEKTHAEARTASKPTITKNSNQVLVKISYSALDTAFEEVAHRTFVGSLLHDIKTSPLVPGWHYSGIVDQVGSQVSDLQPGDAVFGHLPYNSKNKQGSCSEFIVVARNTCAKVPQNVSLETAAAASVEAQTALTAMRDLGGLTTEKSILVIAAGGGVGVQAVQMAKAGLSAWVVHAVCSTRDVPKVKSLGADVVFDRTQMDITKDLGPKTYDVILELTGKYTFRSLKYALNDKGSIVTTVPNVVTMLFGWAVPLINFGKTYKSLIVESRRADMELIADWLATKKIHSVPIDKVFNVRDFMDAWKRQDEPKKAGRVVIKVDGGW